MPTFVKALIAGGTVPAPIKREPSKVILNVSDVGMKLYRWRGGADEDSSAHVSCIVLASTDAEAMLLLNKTMSFKVSQLEFTTCWKRVETMAEIKTPGVYVLKDNNWELRPNKA